MHDVKLYSDLIISLLNVDAFPLKGKGIPAVCESKPFFHQFLKDVV